VFLSYSRRDEAVAVRIGDALESVEGVEVLRDKDDILPAEQWRARLENLLLTADAVVLCLSPDSLGSREVMWEITAAERFSKRIVPVVVRPLEAVAAPESIARLNYLDLTRPEAWDAGLESLRQAIHTDIEWVREHTRLGEQAERWSDSRRASDLLRGPALEAAESWLARQPRHAPPPTAAQRGFVTASRRAATRRQRQWVAGSTTVAIVAIALSLLAYWQRNVAVDQRTNATARQLVAEAQFALAADPLSGGDPPAVNLLASLALRPSAVAGDALEEAVRRLPPAALGSIPWPDQGGLPRVVRFSPDGHWLASVTDRALLVWDVGARRLALHEAIQPGEREARLDFVDGAPRALLRLQPMPGADGSPAWLLVDFAAGQITELPTTTTLDVIVHHGSAIALCRPVAAAASRDPCGARDDARSGVALLDLADRSAKPLPRGGDAPQQGFLFEERPPPVAAASGMTVFGQAPVSPSPPDSLFAMLFDNQDKAVLVDINANSTQPFNMPAKAQILALDTGQGLLAIRVPEHGDIVQRLPRTEPEWDSGSPEARFRRFVEGGMFILVQERDSLSYRTLLGNQRFSPEANRRTDWDLDAMGQHRYTPIVDLAIAGREGRIATAWKDGRIGLWQFTAAPRYGAWAAMPMPTFQEIVHFDHGREFGLQGSWVQFPSLFVSDSGRMLGSQSLTRGANAMGFAEAFDPVLRVWDTCTRTEHSRLRGGGPRLVTFSPDDRVMATLELSTPGRTAASESARQLEIRLWDVSDTAETAAPAEAGPITTLELTPRGPGAPAAEAAMITASLPRQSSGPFWIGADFVLRFLSAAGEVVKVDDLKAALLQATQNPASGPGAEDQAATGAPEHRARGAQAALDRLPASMPVMGFMGVLSGDGQRAAVAVPGSLRVYAVAPAPRLVRTIDLRPFSASGWPLVTGLPVSPDGDRIALSFTEPARRDDARESAADQGKLLLFGPGSDQPVLRRESVALSHPIIMGAWLGERPLGVSNDGRRLVLDLPNLPNHGAAGGATVRTVLLDLQRAGDPTVLAERPVAPSMMGWEVDAGEPPVAAFSPEGNRVAVMRELPACGTTLTMTQAMMPVRVADGSARIFALELWDPAGPTRILSIRVPGLVDTPEPAAGAAMAPTPMAMNAATGAAPSTSLQLPNPGRAVFTSFAIQWPDAQHGGRAELHQLHRSVLMGDLTPAISVACARLPREVLPNTPEAWQARLPQEPFRPLCAAEAPR
jgi:hypothetical protein